MADHEVQSDTIWANVSITKQLQQYEPIRIEAGARKSVSNIDDKQEWELLWKMLEDQLEQQVKDIFPQQ